MRLNFLPQEADLEIIKSKFESGGLTIDIPVDLVQHNIQKGKIIRGLWNYPSVVNTSYYYVECKGNLINKLLKYSILG